MKAAVYHGPGDIRVEEVPDRKPEADEVQIQISYCGVCGTDLHIYHGDGGSFAVKPPLIPGHEFSGVITQVGSAVQQLKVGDRVTGDPNIMCGRCYFCRSGMEHFCTDNIGVGTTADGGFAEYLTMRASHVAKIPDNLDLMTAAMAEPMSCCLHGIDLCRIKAGDTVLVMGGGPIGMMMLQLAKLSGASQVLLSEPVEEKRKLALELGADAAVDPVGEAVEDFLAERTPNVDCVIECVGNVRTQADAVHLAGKGATVMFFGLTGPDARLEVSPDVIFKKELKITSSFINPYTFARAIKVLSSGEVDVKKIITHVLALDEIERALTDPKLRRSGKVMIKAAHLPSG